MGESGTGKELIAAALHRNSPRRDKPFVSLNCAVLSDTLLESQLFGHVRGAFTGAVINQKGLLEEADSGTLFLDEIGDVSPAVQAKLLRVTQEKDFIVLGSTRSR
jgi:two-component system response regulator HydG